MGGGQEVPLPPCPPVPPVPTALQQCVGDIRKCCVAYSLFKKVTPAVTTSSVVIPVHNWVKAYLKNILSHAEIVVIV